MAPGRRQRAAKRRKHGGRQASGKGPPQGGPAAGAASPAASKLPVAFAFALAAIAFVPRVQESAVLARSFWAAAAVLLLWHLVLSLRLASESEGRPGLRVQARPQHYVQGLVQLSVYAYWGFYWRPVYDYAWLLAGQLAFAYAFDMLLAWSRRKTYVLGFGPFPIILSTNLFLWFRDDWYYLQFVMLSVGFLGKEFVRWRRGEREVHVFNPSAFSLALFSLALIATGTTELTRGQEIATTLSLAPYIYLFLFLAGLVVMYFFSITLIAGSAAAVLFGASALYSAATGVPYFVDSEIPTAVFLGLHLLVTDPSTSPRRPLGKLLFGVGYGLGVFALYALLGAFGVPTFYDKLLCVPLLNLSVRWIDRLVAGREAPKESAEVIEVAKVAEVTPAPLRPAGANLAHMAVWIAFFGVMASLGATDATHRGDRIPFWEQACAEGRRHACERLVRIETAYCDDNSGWACNEVGGHYALGEIVEPDRERALELFSRACELRFQAGCVNLLEPGAPRRAPPRALDLRLLLREGGANLVDLPEPALFARACGHGWQFACGGAVAGGS